MMVQCRCKPNAMSCDSIAEVQPDFAVLHRKDTIYILNYKENTNFCS